MRATLSSENGVMHDGDELMNVKYLLTWTPSISISILLPGTLLFDARNIGSEHEYDIPMGIPETSGLCSCK